MSLGFFTLASWTVVALVVGGTTTLYFALGLPPAAVLIGTVVVSAYGPLNR